MKAYKIWCEYDMGFEELYSTEEKAQEAINEVDWVGLCDTTKEEMFEQGLLGVNEIDYE